MSFLTVSHQETWQILVFSIHFSLLFWIFWPFIIMLYISLLFPMFWYDDYGITIMRNKLFPSALKSSKCSVLYNRYVIHWWWIFKSFYISFTHKWCDVWQDKMENYFSSFIEVTKWYIQIYMGEAFGTWGVGQTLLLIHLSWFMLN